MRQSVALKKDFSLVLQIFAQIPWGHHILILTKVKESEIPTVEDFETELSKLEE